MFYVTFRKFLCYLFSEKLKILHCRRRIIHMFCDSLYIVWLA